MRRHPVPGATEKRSFQTTEIRPMTGRPRQDSNLRHRLRRPVLYPLSYGGKSRGTIVVVLTVMASRALRSLPYPA